MQSSLRCWLCSLVFLMPSLASTQAWAVTSTFTAVNDVTLIEDFPGAPARANGAASAMYVGQTQRDGYRRGLIRFDIASIPAGATIQSATLSLHLVRTRPDEGDLTLHKALNSWGEGASSGFGGGGVDAAPNDATWTYRFFGTALTWATLGGDFVASPSASKDIAPVEGSTHLISSAGMAADVLAWVNTPASNHGWLLKDLSSAKAYASHENSNPAFRPTLTIVWTEPVVAADADIPLPPWVLLIFAVGLFWLTSRTKKPF